MPLLKAKYYNLKIALALAGAFYWLFMQMDSHVYAIEY
jgi:hypothetical protein